MIGLVANGIFGAKKSEKHHNHTGEGRARVLLSFAGLFTAECMRLIAIIALEVRGARPQRVNPPVHNVTDTNYGNKRGGTWRGPEQR